jgi:hypothetical protein
MRLASIDRRTRSDAAITSVRDDEFFAEQFPALVERHGELAGAGLRALGGRPLTLEAPQGVWTLAAPDGTLAVRTGPVDGAVVIELDATQFSDWSQQLRTFNAMSVAHEVRMHHGSDRQLQIWDAVWVALLEGWPAVTSDLDFRDRGGDPLDLDRVFTPDDDPTDTAHFLREAGYLHLRDWLDPSAMATIADDIDRALPSYAEGDGRSWWAGLADGSRRCVRLQHFVEHSPTTAELLASDRWDTLRRVLAGDDDLVQAPIEGNCIEALVKPLGVVEGISDVPWHRDCNFGRHAYGCSSTTIGISVTAANATSGQLRVVAGSHRVAMPPLFASDESYLPVVPVPTETGDLTVHLSCTLHEAMPPLERERKVMYTGFGLRPHADARPDAKADLASLRERAHTLTSQPASPVARQSTSRTPSGSRPSADLHPA